MGIAVSGVANIFILIILCDFCFLPKNYDQPELYATEIPLFFFAHWTIPNWFNLFHYVREWFNQRNTNIDPKDIGWASF
jgi:hypothetical protein